MYWPESTFDIIVCFLLKKKKDFGSTTNQDLFVSIFRIVSFIFSALVSYSFSISFVSCFSVFPFITFFFIFLAFAICYSTFVRPFFLFSYHVFFSYLFISFSLGPLSPCHSFSFLSLSMSYFLFCFSCFLYSFPSFIFIQMNATKLTNRQPPQGAPFVFQHKPTDKSAD